MIAYYRVSTQKQGLHGLGMKAQAAAVRMDAKSSGAKLIAEYEEVASGRDRNRPILRQALAHAETCRVPLVVAKLDRLARDARYVLDIIDSPVRVRFLDLPGVDPVNREEDRMTVTMMAAVAEYEGRRTARRVRDANQQKSPRQKAANRKHLKRVGRSGTDRRVRATEDFAAKVLPLVEELRKRRTLGQVAKELNRRGISTFVGKPWTVATVDAMLRKGRKSQAVEA